jgi:hypothetical protein
VGHTDGLISADRGERTPFARGLFAANGAGGGRRGWWAVEHRLYNNSPGAGADRRTAVRWPMRGVCHWSRPIRPAGASQFHAILRCHAVHASTHLDSTDRARSGAENWVRPKSAPMMASCSRSAGSRQHAGRCPTRLRLPTAIRSCPASRAASRERARARGGAGLAQRLERLSHRRAAGLSRPRFEIDVINHRKAGGAL